MSELDRLRAEAKRLRKAVTNKISRTRRTTGAEIAGSEFDPRRSAGVENRYNAATLRKYIDTMKPFMARSNQFVPDANMRPLPRHEFRTYKANEIAQKRMGDIHAESMAAIKTPTGLSVKQSQGIIPQSQGSAVYGPYKQFDRESTDIASREAMQKLNADLKKQASPTYLSEQLQKGKDNLITVLEILGETEHIEMVENLSEFQFDVFWFGTNAAEAVFMQYGIEKERAAGTRKEQWQDKVVESAANELGPILQWASTEVPVNRPAEASEKIKGFRR